MSSFKALSREPLVHFLIIGAVLFTVFELGREESSAAPDRILVDAGQVQQLVARFRRSRLRAPTESELAALIEGHIREEVYYRQALAMGLERDDTIVRRRLKQKLEFMTDTGADLIEPQAGELEAYYEANVERFQDTPAIALTQAYLGQNPSPDRINAALSSLKSDAEADPNRWSEPTLLPSQMAISTPVEIDSVFGTGFFDNLMQLPMEEWIGPIESGYGLHLVRIDDSRLASLPPFEGVRDAILREWKSVKAKELSEQVYTRLRERYTIVLPDGAALNNL